MLASNTHSNMLVSYTTWSHKAELVEMLLHVHECWLRSVTNDPPQNVKCYLVLTQQSLYSSFHEMCVLLWVYWNFAVSFLDFDNANS